ncbi:MAG: prealbumin-like fold domain-containing protein, partial [Varibaculum timonense]
MKRTGSNINGQNNDLNAADRAAQPHQLSAANHGNPDTTYSDHIKAPAYNRRTLGVASALGVLFSSLLAVTLFFTSADNSASQAPKFDAKTVSENTIFAFAQLKPAEFSPASSFNRSVLDPADISSSPKARGSFTASRNQGVAETTVAQPSSANSARSQCSGGDCVSPRRAPVAPTVKLKLFKLGVTDPKLVKNCLFARKVCSAGDGELVAGARFALYEGRTVDETKLIDTYTVGEDGVEISGLQQGSYTLKEVEAPAGYELNPNNVSLNVKSDGRVERGRGKIFAYLENNEFYFPNLK